MLHLALLFATPFAIQTTPMEPGVAKTGPAETTPASWLLRPDGVILPDGTVQNMDVLVVGDRIQAVGPDLESDVPVLRLSGILSPGFVDAFARISSAENYRRTTPQLHAADGIHWDDVDYQEACWKAGVTGVHWIPQPSNVVSGWGTFSAVGESHVRQSQTQAVVSLHPTQVVDDRLGPGSLPGALEILRAALPTMNLKGTSLLAYVDSAEAVRSFRTVVGNTPHHFVVPGSLASFGGLLGDQLVGLASFEGARQNETMIRLHKRGLRFALGTDGSRNPAGMRHLAMRLSRATKDPAAAMRSLTSAAAEFAGLKDVGRVESGAMADLTLWSGHPLDPSSKLKAVMVGGKTMYRATPVETQP